MKKNFPPDSNTSNIVKAHYFENAHTSLTVSNSGSFNFCFTLLIRTLLEKICSFSSVKENIYYGMSYALFLLLLTVSIKWNHVSFKESQPSAKNSCMCNCECMVFLNDITVIPNVHRNGSGLNDWKTYVLSDVQFNSSFLSNRRVFRNINMELVKNTRMIIHSLKIESMRSPQYIRSEPEMFW